jgi:hypothetical protein
MGEGLTSLSPLPVTPVECGIDLFGHVLVTKMGIVCNDCFNPRSRGQAEPHDFCSGREPGYCLSPYSAMMLPRKLP